MTKVLTEVRNMRGRQESLDTKLGAIKHENEALWREIAMLRQKHLKQQQIVNKLIQFLMTVVQPSRGGGLSVKRRYPLMINDSNRTCKQSKLPKVMLSLQFHLLFFCECAHTHAVVINIYFVATNISYGTNNS